MNIAHFENFVVLAEEKSIAKAARTLFMSASTLSKQLIALENELGMTLFKRDTNPLELTYAGQIFLETAKKVLSETTEMNKKLQDVSECGNGRIQLGVSCIRTDCDFQYILPKFMERYPSCCIDLTSSTSRTLCDRLLSGELDIAVCSDYFKSDQLSYDNLVKEELLLLVSKDHPLAKYAGFDENGKRFACKPEWFENECIMLQSKESPSRYLFSNFLNKACIPPKISIMNCSSLLLLQIASQTNKCTIYSEHYLKHFPNLVGFSFDPPAYQQFTIIKRASYKYSRQEQYLISLIKEFYNK